MDPARARRGRSRSTSTGVAGSGLCLRVKHDSPEHLRLNGQIGKKGMEGPERSIDPLVAAVPGRSLPVIQSLQFFLRQVLRCHRAPPLRGIALGLRAPCHPRR